MDGSQRLNEEEEEPDPALSTRAKDQARLGCYLWGAAAWDGAGAGEGTSMLDMFCGLSGGFTGVNCHQAMTVTCRLNRQDNVSPGLALFLNSPEC